MLAGIDGNAVSSIAIHPTPIAQLRIDLDWCNGNRLADGSFPLVRWLHNAAMLTKPFVHGAKFADFRDSAKTLAGG